MIEYLYTVTAMPKKEKRALLDAITRYCEKKAKYSSMCVLRKDWRRKLPTALTLRFSLRQRMVYYLFWTAYSTKVDAGDFETFFGVPRKRMYGAELKIAKL